MTVINVTTDIVVEKVSDKKNLDTLKCHNILGGVP